MTTLAEKFRISLGSAILFLGINLPQTYSLTNSILPFNLVNTTTNCPTATGLLIHLAVFFISTFLSMGNPYDNTWIKVKHSLYGSLIFFFLSNPTFFSLLNSLMGNQFAGANGCPTLLGVIISTILYCMALIAIMYLPERNQ